MWKHQKFCGNIRAMNQVIVKQILDHSNLNQDSQIKLIILVVQLKDLRNFWRTEKMLLINCEIGPSLKWSTSCVIRETKKETTFAITDTKIFIPVVNLSNQR